MSLLQDMHIEDKIIENNRNNYILRAIDDLRKINESRIEKGMIIHIEKHDQQEHIVPHVLRLFIDRASVS